jgi:hypothetical protein
MRRRRLIAAAAVGLLAACDGDEVCIVSGPSCEARAVTIELSPWSLTLGVGDTASVAVSVQQGGRPARPAVRWEVGAPPGAPVSPPAIVALDSLTVTQSRVRLRATAAGLTVLNAWVTVEGLQYGAAVPVTVIAR